MPFGISSAPEVFQRKNFEIFGDLQGVGLYFDDLIITGKDVLSKFVKFMGQIYSKKGVEPNRSYIQAIVDMPRPENKSDLLRILGMAKYLGKFVPSMSRVTASLRELTRQDVDFVW